MFLSGATYVFCYLPVSESSMGVTNPLMVKGLFPQQAFPLGLCWGPFDGALEVSAVGFAVCINSCSYFLFQAPPLLLTHFPCCPKVPLRLNPDKSVVWLSVLASISLQKCWLATVILFFLSYCLTLEFVLPSGSKSWQFLSSSLSPCDNQSNWNLLGSHCSFCVFYPPALAVFKPFWPWLF